VLFVVNINANSATVAIPANSTWWSWSTVSDTIILFNLETVDDLVPVDDGCGIALNIPVNESSPKLGLDTSNSTIIFKVDIWSFTENKITPLLNPNTFSTTSAIMIETCPNLPCPNYPVMLFVESSYFVLAIKNYNTETKKVKFTVPWIIDCTVPTSSPTLSPISPPTESKSLPGGVTFILCAIV
ncbi:4868_t:CDS:2, partial [Gigaspora margarita]